MKNERIKAEIIPFTNEWDAFFRNEIIKDKFQNVYLYIDVAQLGFVNDNVESFIAFDNGKPMALLYIYYSSLQLFCVQKFSDSVAKEIAKFIFERKIIRVSGRTDEIDAVSNFLPCKITSGYIMSYTGEDCNKKSELAKETDLPEIAQLICSDKNLGNSYTYDSLILQMRNRMLNNGCKSRIIRIDGKIVSHFATFAVWDDIAVLSGMVTHPNYRNQGFGGILVRDLSNEVKYNDNKRPLLYCYEEQYYTWYQKLGYETIGKSSKIEVLFT